MVKSELKTKYKTNYHLELVDSRTGQVKEKVDTTNIFLSPWWNGACNEYCTGRLVRNILFGSGTGTAAESDTGCFRHLWTVGAASETRTMDVETKWMKFVAKTTVPATSSYVGNITEICCDSCATAPSSSQGAAGTFTHALLKDAEGNPIAITKTDVDILEVTITIEITYSASAPWTLVKYPGYLLRQRGSDILRYAFAISHWAAVWFSLGTTQADPNILSGYAWGRTPTLGIQAANQHGYIVAYGSMNRTTKKMTFGNVRIATSVGENRPYYFNYILFSGLCHTALPNFELFPKYDIEGINIGLGDGQTMFFDNPLNYFAKDTERVYKDDALLVRGVDYNIDYRNNHNRLPELAATRNCKALSGVELAAGVWNGHKQVLFQRRVNNSDAYLMEDTFVGWTAEKPFVIKLDDFAQEATAVDGTNDGTVSPWRDVNTFYCPAWVVTGAITLFHSEDGEEWEQLCTINHVSGTADTKTFTVVNAPYWKIEGTNTTWTAHGFTTDDVAQEVFLGYVGNPYVVFTEAPGEGAVLRMDVSMDRPFKNGNFVIDLSAELQMS